MLSQRNASVLQELTAILFLAYFSKLALDQMIWRYSGPVSLALTLFVVFIIMKRNRQQISSIGLVKFSHKKQYLWVFPQIFLAFIGIMVSGIAVGLAGEALNIGFMTPDPSGAENRFGDLAGNTKLYGIWIAIVWIAGPMEELFFRGYLISKIKYLLGSRPFSTSLSVVIPAILFGLGHIYYMGLRGFFMTGAIGVTMGVLFILYKRNIWPLMIAHAAFNTFVFTAMYMQWDV